MNKLLSGYFLLNLFFILFNAAMAGGGGIASTPLTNPVTTSSTVITVGSTNGFLSSDVIVIDSEYIFYSATTPTTFTGLIRGYNSSKPSAHNVGKYVYTQEINMLNETLGFNVAATQSTSGPFTVIALGFTFIGRSLINLVIWDFPNIFQGQLIYLRLCLIAIGCGLVIYIAINYLLPAMGILKSS